MENKLAHADQLVEAVKKNEQEKKKYEEIANERIEAIKAQLQAKLDKLDSNTSYIKSELLQIANMSDTKETKTQRKLELLAGDVIIKKPRKRFKRDNKALLSSIKNIRPDLIKERVTESVDWATYKNELAIDDNFIINKLTGEVVELEGLEVEEVPESVEVV